MPNRVPFLRVNALNMDTLPHTSPAEDRELALEHSSMTFALSQPTEMSLKDTFPILVSSKHFLALNQRLEPREEPTAIACLGPLFMHELKAVISGQAGK